MLQTTNFTTPTSISDRLVEQIHACREFPAMASVPAGNIEPLAWLAAQTCPVKLVWSERDEKEVIVGVGEAASVTAEPGVPAGELLCRCRNIIGNHHALRFYGGISFDGKDAWPDFGAGRFLLPRFLLQDEMLQAVVLDRHDIVAASLDVQQLNMDPSTPDTALPNPTEIAYAPDRDAWRTNVNDALDLVHREVLEKVVLARETRMVFSEPIDPVCLTTRIADSTHDCYIYCFQLGEQLAFVGATPERLFKRQGDKLLSEILAGTRPRGNSVGEDQRLAYELLTSDKDQLEHDIVRKSIRQKLHQIVDHLDVDSHASVLRLARKQHLCSKVEATLKAGVTEGQLLERLHPTPAVGGYPTENALPEIARLEPFNRGWYAAPIGWVGRSEAEFVVAIRSGLVDGRQLKLYSGAGIVNGSEPDQEWAEIENKICDFVNVLGT